MMVKKGCSCIFWRRKLRAASERRKRKCKAMWWACSRALAAKSMDDHARHDLPVLDLAPRATVNAVVDGTHLAGSELERAL